MTRYNPDARLAMRGAWKLARQGATIYGGSVRLYFREALRIAWAEVKADPVAQEARRMCAEIRARKKRLDDPMAGLSPGLRAAAARASRRYATRCYGNGYGAAYYTASW